MMGVAMMGPRAWLLWAQDWIMEMFDREAPCARRTLRATAVLVALSLVACRPAFGGIIEDAVKSGLEGMLGYVVARVNAMGDQSLPTSFTNLFNGASGSHLIYAKALELYVGGVAKAIAASLLSLTMLVQLVRIAQRTEASPTFPAAREVITLLVICSVYTWLVGHAWELMAAIFQDLSQLWGGWTAEAPARIDDVSIEGVVGLEALLPMFLSTAVCLLLADVAAISTRVVVWGRGMQLYFLATMSPIPLALLGIEETRQMGIGFLRNYASLVLGYAALSFVINLFPSLLAMAVETSWQAGGADEMILSVMCGCVLQVVLVFKCGGWARDLLGG